MKSRVFQCLHSNESQRQQLRPRNYAADNDDLRCLFLPFFEHFTLMILLMLNMGMLQVATVSIAVMFNSYNNYCIFYSDTRNGIRGN